MSKKIPIIKCMRTEDALVCLMNTRAKDIIWDALHGRRVQAFQDENKEEYMEIDSMMAVLDMKPYPSKKY